MVLFYCHDTLIKQWLPFISPFRDFGPILLPLQSAMRVTLPSTPGNHVDHNPFPTEPVFLQSFEETVSAEISGVRHFNFVLILFKYLARLGQVIIEFF